MPCVIPRHAVQYNSCTHSSGRQLVPTPRQQQHMSAVRAVLSAAYPNEATRGARTREILSPTPPVECLSDLWPGISDRSAIPPDYSHISAGHKLGHGDIMLAPHLHHCERQLCRLSRRHAVDAHRHQPCRHLVVRHFACRETLDERVNVGGCVGFTCSAHASRPYKPRVSPLFTHRRASRL